MTKQELELEREVNIDYLNDILRAWRSPDRRLRKVFVLVVVLATIAVYFTASNLLGMTWGYIATIAVLFAAYFCADQLGLSFKTKIWPDGKLADRLYWEADSSKRFCNLFDKDYGLLFFFQRSNHSSSSAYGFLLTPS